MAPPTVNVEFGMGPVQQGLRQSRLDPLMMRPFIDDNGERCVLYRTGRMLANNVKVGGPLVPQIKKARIRDMEARGIHHPVWNATSLRKEEWIELDRVVMLAARQRLRAWADLAAANSFGGFNAYGRLTLEYEAMSDPGSAVIDMDALTDGRNDAPLFKLRSLPLPITHSDFWFSERRLMTSQNSGTPLDTTMAEAAARRCAESVELVTIGETTGLTFGTQPTGITAHDGNSTIFGYKNFTFRLTKTNMTAPTTTNPEVVLADFLAAKDQLTANRFYGPWMVYHTADWDRYMDSDYARLGGDNASMTLRDRLRKTEGIIDVRRLDLWDDTTSLLFVQMTSDVARAIVGMDFTTVQWETKGGLQQNFKVMCILVPQLRYDYNGRTGILHATTA